MKKSKKLMILGLSAATACVAATSAVSSFAWFATNATVTATGMKVKIQSAATLVIDTDSKLAGNGMLETGASTKNLGTTTSKSLNPTSTIDGTNWYYAQASEATASTAKDGSYKEVESADGYYLSNTVYLQSFDGSKPAGTGATYEAYDPAKKIVIDSITVAYKSTDKLSSSFRVLVTSGSTAVFCGPTSTTTPTNKVVKTIDESKGTATLESVTYATVGSKDSNNKASLTANNTIVSAVKYNEVYTVNIYLYFEGEDATCKSENIPDKDSLEDYTVTVSFSITDAA